MQKKIIIYNHSSQLLFFFLKISPFFFFFLSRKLRIALVFLNPAMTGAISFIFIVKFQLHTLHTWLIHRGRALKFECTKYKAGQSFKMLAEANNLNFFLKSEISHWFKNLWPLRKLFLYVEKENINRMLTRLWHMPNRSCAPFLCIFSWHSPGRGATRSSLLSRGDSDIWPQPKLKEKLR